MQVYRYITIINVLYASITPLKLILINIALEIRKFQTGTKIYTDTWRATWVPYRDGIGEQYLGDNHEAQRKRAQRVPQCTETENSFN